MIWSNLRHLTDVTANSLRLFLLHYPLRNSREPARVCALKKQCSWDLQSTRMILRVNLPWKNLTPKKCYKNESIPQGQKKSSHPGVHPPNHFWSNGFSGGLRNGKKGFKRRLAGPAAVGLRFLGWTGRCSWKTADRSMMWWGFG